MDTGSQVELGTLGARTLVALGLALVVNGAVLAVVLGGDLVSPYESLAVGPVVFLTTLGVVGGAVVYGVLSRVTGRPARTFVAVAGVVLLLSFVPNVNLLVSGEAPADAVAVLMILHVPPAGASVAALTGWLWSLGA